MLHLEKMRWRPQEKGWPGVPLLASAMVTMMVVAVVMVLVRREYRTGKRHQQKKNSKWLFHRFSCGHHRQRETKAEGLQEQNLPAQAAFRRAVARESRRRWSGSMTREAMRPVSAFQNAPW